MSKKKLEHKMLSGVCIRCGETLDSIVKSGSEICGLKKKRRVNVNNVLKKAADDLFSIRVRAECGWRCIKCKERFNPASSLNYLGTGNEVIRSKSWGDSKKLHAAHFHKRAKFNTRWDHSNVWAMCGSMRPGGGGRWVLTGCHAETETTGTDGWNWYRDFITEKIGEGLFNEMELRANSPSTGHDFQVIILQNFLIMEKLGYSMEWFVETHQEHLKFNLRAATISELAGIKTYDV